MKFTCSQSDLAKALTMVSKAVSLRTTIPILKGILLKVSQGQLILTASDLDLSIEATIDGSDWEEGSAVVSARLFSDIVRSLPRAPVQLEKKEENSLLLTCLASDFTIVSLPADEFPLMGNMEKERKVSLDKEGLKKIIQRTTFSASIDEKKGILVGCLLEMKDDDLVMVALDGFRMAVAREKAGASLTGSIVVPARILNEIHKLLSEGFEEDSVHLYLDEKKMEMEAPGLRVTSRLMEGDFIKYQDIIPKDSKLRCRVNREELQRSIERASLLAKEGKNNLIKLSLSQDAIEITSRSEQGHVREEVSAHCEGEDLVIGFNSKYLIDVLKSVEEEEVILSMTSPTSPCLVTPVEGDGFLYLVLPVRIAAG